MNTEPQIKIIVPEQFTADQKGKFFEKIASDLLKKQRFEVTQRVRLTGMEIDVLAEHMDTGQQAFVECKFVKAPFSADVLSKLIGNARAEEVPLAYLFSTASPSKDAKGFLKKYIGKKDPILVHIGPDELAQMYIDVQGVSLPNLTDWNIEAGSVGAITLLIVGRMDLETSLVWVVEQKREGTPYRATLIPISSTSEIIVDEFRAAFERQGLWLGLEIVKASERQVQREQQIPSPVEAEEEVVTPVSMADQFDDYRPCRPADFVGRYDLQKNIWGYLEKVRMSETSTRIICFTGPSGFGKSSIVLKLADRFRNVKWRKKLFLYHVDVRSAKGPLFVAKAVRSAFKEAIDEGFIESIGDSSISIESTESFFSGASIQKALDNLKSSNRVLVIFFDQFEELFTKESLIPTFETFRQLAFEVDSLQSNIVLGFSWRTGIALPDDHPAYYLWQSLADKRLEFKLTHFTGRESSLLLSQLEKNLGEKLVGQLRRRLLEQGQGLPWLLKKLCIHVYRQLSNGTNQQELLARHLDVRILFDADLEPLTEKQHACLRYIAKNSPADIIDITDKYGRDTLEQLYSSRLVVRTGSRYTVYWDIFRDYIIDGEPPSIPLTYIPQTQLSTVLKAFDILKSASKDSTELAEELGYSLKTVANIAVDLQTFFLVQRDRSGKFSVPQTLKDATDDLIAEHLAKQFREHVILGAIHEELEPGRSMSIESFRSLISAVNPVSGLRPRTLDTYVKRILPWFRFAWWPVKI